MYKRTRWGMISLTMLLALCVWTVYEVPLQLGIDLRGGTELTYALDLSRIDSNRSEVAEEVKDIIAKRLNGYGLKEISVSVQGTDRLVIQLPGTDRQTVDELKWQIEQAGNLTFRLVAGNEHRTDERLDQYEQEERDYLVSDRDWVRKKLANPAFADQRPQPPDFLVRYEVKKEMRGDREEFVPQPDSRTALENRHVYNDDIGEWEAQGIVSGRYLGRVGETLDPQTYQPALSFEFRGEGATLFGDLTGANKGRLLSIVLDDDIMQVATIREQITTRGQITGSFTSKEVRAMVSILRGGSLPTKPTLISESTVGSLLGQDSIESGVRAVIVGALGVMVVMTIYYLAAGMVANMALALNILLIFSFMTLFRQTLTLPGLAGVILTLGMAVDANILIFERFREERQKGKPLLPSLTAGYARAFWVIFDSNLTTLITGFVLFNLGTPEIKGFAVTLIAGITASFFTSIFVTRLLLSLLCNIGVITDLNMLQAFRTPRIPFVRYQKRFMAASLIVIVATWSLVLYRGRANYGIDFTGGARVTMNLLEKVSVDSMREKVAALAAQEPELFNDWTIQTIHPDAEGRASTYILLTRAGAERGFKQVNAQEPPAAGKEPVVAPAAASETPLPSDVPEPAEKGEEAAPAGTEPEGAVDPTPASPAGEAPAKEPVVPEPAAPAVAAEPPTLAELEGEQAPEDEPAQRVQRALEDLLSAESLLLPVPFPVSEWKGDRSPGAPAGSEYLELEVNLLEVSPEFTTERIQEEINTQLDASSLFTRTGRNPDNAYKGVDIVKVELVSKPTDEVPVTRYQVRTSSYEPPLPGSLTDADVPTKKQVEEEVRGYFREQVAPDQLRISEPFPQVLTVGPRVASNLQADALVALFISVVGIVFYLSLRFEFVFGLAGIIALLHDTMVVIGVMALADHFLPDFAIKFNLTELAAVLSIIGYSINDTIVLFDRVRENTTLLAKRKYSLENIVDISVNQTLQRTLWTSLTTLLVIVMLLGFGGESVRGFAFLFAVGLVAGSYSSVFIAAPVAIHLHNRSVARREAASQA